VEEWPIDVMIFEKGNDFELKNPCEREKKEKKERKAGKG